MTAANFPKVLSFTLKYEGGFSNNPRDPGGATNKGITLYTYRHYHGQDATVDQLKHISDPEVAQIYRGGYWNTVQGDYLPDGVDLAVFDFAVNSGPSRAVKFLQQLVHPAVGGADGVMGPSTLAAVHNAATESIIKQMCINRLEFLEGLDTWDEFGGGWTTRVNACKATGLIMSGQATAASASPPATASNEAGSGAEDCK